MTKRILSLLLALLIVFGLTACSEQELVDAALDIAGQLLNEDEAPQSTPVDVSPEVTAEAEKPQSAESKAEELPPAQAAPAIAEDGLYTTKEDVALYLHTYGKLPGNFITKSEARALGWEGGDLDPYAPDMCIGGDRFGNYEGLLPDGEYQECDIDTLNAKSRGAKRLVFNDEGDIYYTDDHYESFEKLY